MGYWFWSNTIDEVAAMLWFNPWLEFYFPLFQAHYHTVQSTGIAALTRA